MGAEPWTGESLEERVFDGRPIALKPEDKITVCIEKDEERTFGAPYLVMVQMPWNEGYMFNRYKSEEEARKDFERINSHLENGGQLRLIEDGFDNTKVELYEEK